MAVYWKVDQIPPCTSTSIIPPAMEYCSHIWGGAPKNGCHDLLDRVQKCIVNIIGSNLSIALQSLSHRRHVASLRIDLPCKCSAEIAGFVPPRQVNVRTTSFSERLHQYCVCSTQCNRMFYQGFSELFTISMQP